MACDFDVLVIGGGVVGCAILRELSRYKLAVALVEKESDVARGTSGRNSGVVHAGFNVKPETLKARLNLEGHLMFAKYCRELGVPYDEVGKLVVAKSEEEVPYLEKLKKQGELNGITAGLRIVEGGELSRMEPNIRGIAALHSPRSAITCPFTLTIALAENATRNGARVFLDTEVTAVSQHEWGFAVDTAAKGTLNSRVVVNSAGLFSAQIAGMVGINEYKIRPCRGEYHVLDGRARGLVNGMVYPVPMPGSGVLGIHITPTVDGNLMLGPSAEYIDDREDTANTATVMERLYMEAAGLLPKIKREDSIRSFSGIRPKLVGRDDFIIEESDRVPGFINLTGIESPGLTSSPAIAKMVAGIIGDAIGLGEPRPDFDPVRKARRRFSRLPESGKAALIRQNPAHGPIICRCETVTGQEVLEAIDNPLGARTLNGIKMRCRAGMGRCQGGFCTPKIVEILEKEFGMDVDGLTLAGPGSELFVGRTKDLLLRAKGEDGR